MAKRGLSDAEKKAVQAQLRRWLDELKTQRAVGDRVGVTQQAVGDALNYGRIGYGLAIQVAEAAGFRSLAGFVDATAQTAPAVVQGDEPTCVSLVPKHVDLDRLPAALRRVLEGNAIPARVREVIPALVAMRYARGASMTEADFVAEAQALYRRAHDAELGSLKAAEGVSPAYGASEPDPVAERKAATKRPR